MTTLTPRYVAVIPPILEEGVLYICERYETVSHKCCCGCGAKTVTPLSPTDWRLIKNGSMVSLYPSIGNWSLPCRSHYWIRRNRVIWADDWSQAEIDAARAKDRRQKDRYYKKQYCRLGDSSQPTNRRRSILRTIKRWIS